MSAAAVFPVGHYGGAGPGTAHLVRVGRKLERLTDDEFGIWMLAHGLADVGKGNWGRSDVLDRARDAEIAEPEACLERLIANGLLAVVPAEGVDAATRFATAYRLCTLLVGLGAAPDQPELHAIGVPGVGTAALLDAGTYRLWQWGGVAPTLWRHCQDRIRSGSDGRDALAALVDPAKVLADVLGELRVLLAHGCAYLDTVEPVAAGTVAGTAPGTAAGTPPGTGMPR
ncbi:hypothetical protein [Flindersiella endophytica]